MKIAKNPPAKETTPVVVAKSECEKSKEYIKCAINELGKIAASDNKAKDAIANLAVVLLDLQ